MTWIHWLLIAWWLLHAVAVTASIGKPRRALTAGDAAISVILAFCFIVLLVMSA